MIEKMDVENIIHENGVSVPADVLSPPPTLVPIPKHEQPFTTIEMIKCSLCKEWCPKIDIRQHTMEHFDSGSTKHHVCDICGKKFKSGQEMKNHAKVHGEKEFHCSYCDRSYYSKQSLEKHESARHTKKDHKVCTHCGESFTTGRTLQSHMKKAHGIENRFQCTNCFTFFLTEQRFRSHDSSKCKPYKCEICGKILGSQPALDQHVSGHGGREKIYSCELCETKFSLTQTLKEHMKRRHGNGAMPQRIHKSEYRKPTVKPFLCHCGKKFALEDELIKHRASHFEQMSFPPHPAFVGHQAY